MTKFHLYYNKDQETDFLNDMSQKGYALTGFFAGFYHFDRCEPGKYIYQIDITEGLWRVSNDYREFMQDMEVEIVCLWGPWVILRKKAQDGPFVLYTDVESSIEHYSRIKMMFKICAALEIAFFFIEVISGRNGNPAAWASYLLLWGIIFLFLREVRRINGILNDLKGRIGDTGKDIGCRGRGKVSGCLVAGLLLNAFALLMPQAAGEYASALGFLKGLIQGAALVLMGMGCIFTFWSSRE